MSTDKHRVCAKLLFLTIIFAVTFTGIITASAQFTIEGWIKTDQTAHDPVIGAHIVFFDSDGTVVNTADSQTPPDDGKFTIDLASGVYEVMIYPPNPDSLSGLHIEEFEVTSDENVGDWYLHYFTTEAYLSGTVYEPTGVSGVEDIVIHLEDGEFFYYDTTDAVGDYQIKFPDAGTYDYFTKNQTDLGFDEYYYPMFDVTNGDTLNVILTSDQTSPSISGTITDSIYGTPYEDVRVIYTLDPVTYPNHGPYVGVTDESGQYALNITAGKSFDITITPFQYSGAETQTEEDYNSSAAPDSDVKNYTLVNPFPVTVTVDDGTTIDELYFTDHNSELDNGNYIRLNTGDITVDLPDPIDVNYSGPRTAENEYDGNTVNAYSAFETRSITSPINTWELYYAPANLMATYHGDPGLADDSVEVRLLTATYDDVIDAITDAKNGDTQPLKDLLADDLETVTKTINATGDFDTNPEFTIDDPGDYTIAIVTETFNPYVLHVYSVAPVEILDYKINVVTEHNATTPEHGVDVKIDFIDVPTATEYSYASILIREDAYSLYADINTDGTVNGTTVDLQHQGDTPKNLTRIASNGEILGIPYSNYMDLLDYDLLNNELGNVYDLDEYSLGSQLETTQTSNVTVSLDTDGFQGQYVLTTIVWEHDTGKRIVAFDQQTITLGQDVTIDSVTTNLPEPYANIITIEYELTSSAEISNAVATYTFSIDGVQIASSTNDVTIDISSGTQTLTYEWDTLIDVADNDYRFGGNVEFTITIQDSSLNELALQTETGMLEPTTKTSLFLDRLNPISFEWGQPGADKTDLFLNYLNPISFLWGLL